MNMSLKSWVLAVFISLILWWALLGTLPHHPDCLCPRCEIIYDREWGEAHK